jgi:hypothetical protein
LHPNASAIHSGYEIDSLSLITIVGGKNYPLPVVMVPILRCF